MGGRERREKCSDAFAQLFPVNRCQLRGENILSLSPSLWLEEHVGTGLKT
jgi:hypothetical protein